MSDHNKFLSLNKSMLIAPAGHGKTHFIAECLKHTTSFGKQLILTHTHAGVASIKEKLKNENIKNSQFQVETIASFAQKYVWAFHIGNLPDQKDKDYYPFIEDLAIKLIKLKPISLIIKNTYNGLFVDEYQDCTVRQHSLILALSDILYTRILGDPLQGIFGFGGDALVNMDTEEGINDFKKEKFELNEPWRWKKHGNEDLGTCLKDIRKSILNKEVINLNKYKTGIEFLKIDNFSDKELYKLYSSTLFSKTIYDLKNEKSLLVLFPQSTTVAPRELFIKNFNIGFYVLESIDDKKFYSSAKFFDLINSNNYYDKILFFIKENFTNIGTWINKENKFIKKKNSKDSTLSLAISEKLKELDTKLSFITISQILYLVSNLPNTRFYRVEILKNLIKALDDAEYQNISVYEAMLNRRNNIRRQGRKVYGKCLATTLLTKGLEFETVLIVNAHQFACPKNLYVALTRASKRLIVMSHTNILNPY